MADLAQTNTPHVFPRIPLPLVLRRFWLAIILLTAAAWAQSFICWRYLHLHYPHSWPLDKTGARFQDFTIYAARFRNFHHIEFFTRPGWPYNQTAPAAVLFELFYGFAPHPLLWFLSLGIAAVLIAAFLFARALRARGIAPRCALFFTATVLLTAFPFAFAFDRANIEVFLWILVAAGVWTFLRGRWTRAAILFGIAGSLKFYPAIFLALLLSKRRYREFALGLLVMVFATAVSLWIVGPTFRIATIHIAQGLASFHSVFIARYQPGGIGFDHSLFSLFKAARPTLRFTSAATAYVLLAAIVSAVLFFWRIRTLPIINQLIALTTAAVLLPPVSYEYTLIHLYIPWALLTLSVVSSAETARHSYAVTFCYACFAVLFTPQSYFILHDHRYEAQVKALVLAALFFVAVRYPLVLEPRTSNRAQPLRSTNILHPLPSAG